MLCNYADTGAIESFEYKRSKPLTNIILCIFALKRCTFFGYNMCGIFHGILYCLYNPTYNCRSKNSIILQIEQELGAHTRTESLLLCSHVSNLYRVEYILLLMSPKSSKFSYFNLTLWLLNIHACVCDNYL